MSQSQHSVYDIVVQVTQTPSIQIRINDDPFIQLPLDFQQIDPFGIIFVPVISPPSIYLFSTHEFTPGVIVYDIITSTWDHHGFESYPPFLITPCLAGGLDHLSNSAVSIPQQTMNPFTNRTSNYVLFPRQNTLYVYDIVYHTWDCFPLPVENIHSIRSLTTFKNTVIIGNISYHLNNKITPSNDLFKLDPKTGTWKTISNTWQHIPRSLRTIKWMCEFNNKLLIIDTYGVCNLLNLRNHSFTEVGSLHVSCCESLGVPSTSGHILLYNTHGRFDIPIHDLTTLPDEQLFKPTLIVNSTRFSHLFIGGIRTFMSITCHD